MRDSGLQIRIIERAKKWFFRIIQLLIWIGIISKFYFPKFIPFICILERYETTLFWNEIKQFRIEEF